MMDGAQIEIEKGVHNKQPNSANCFVCGRENENGLGLSFYEVGVDEVMAEVVIPSHFEGYPGIVHGGIVATMLDEIAERAAMIGEHTRFRLTAKLEIRYRKPVPSEQPLRLRGIVVRNKGRIAFTHTELILADGTVAAEADAVLVDYPRLPGDESVLESLGWTVDPD
ncbi:MAG: PaaI family thioesterase [Anaerolineales bacterium]